MADRMAILTQGRISQIGTPEEIYRMPLCTSVARFIGETNLIAGVVLESDNPRATIETAAGPLIGRLTNPGWRPAPGTAVQVSIRPEAWHLEQETGDNTISGNIIERSYLGQSIQYWLDTAAGRQQVVEMNPQQMYPPAADKLRLHVRKDDVLVLEC